MNIKSRLEKLEAANGNAVVIVWRNHGEKDEQARDRWLAEHPGQDLESAGTRVVIVGWAE